MSGLRTLWQVPPALPPVADPGTVLVDARAVRAVLGGAEVLRGVDVTARAGEVVALVGPNGAGKSTLLGALTGDVATTAGQVRCLGRPLPSWSDADLARHRAVLPQNPMVRFPFSVEQVVRMGRSPWAGTEAEDGNDVAVASAIADADVAHLIGRAVPTLSGGEQARVALARVLAQRTQLLLLDEPTAALDIHHQELALDLLRRRADGGAAVVVVLHDLTLAGAHADRILLLADGVVAGSGPPVEVLQPELLSAVYRHQIDVVPHPATGEPLVLPRRAPRAHGAVRRPRSP